MVSYSKALFYGAFFLFISVVVHEVGHLIIARRLITSEAEIRLFPSFPFGEALGFVEIPGSVSYPLWKGVAVSVSGPLLASILMLVIWVNTKSVVIAAISSFFAMHQLSYAVVEPMHFLGLVPMWFLWLPYLVAGAWLLPYSYYIEKDFRYR